MYLTAIILNHNRKERLCKECKEPILPNTDNLMLMKRGRKGGRYYVYLHPFCVLTVLWKERERRRIKSPKKTGRPSGSSLAELSPELRAERHRLIRARARLLRVLVAEDDEDRICQIVARTKRLRECIEEILPFQIKSPGHRSMGDSHTINEKVRIAERIRRRGRQDDL